MRVGDMKSSTDPVGAAPQTRMSGRRGARLALALCIATECLFAGNGLEPSVAHAQPSKAEEAKQRFLKGVDLFGESDFQGSLVEFKRSYEIVPNFTVLYNIGQVYFQLKDYANALKTLQQYMDIGGGRIPASRRDAVEKDLEKLKGRVATITIKVNVPGAEVFVDDASVGKSPLAAPVIVSSGKRRFTATKEGFNPGRESRDIASSEATEVSISLSELAPGQKPVIPPVAGPGTGPGAVGGPAPTPTAPASGPSMVLPIVAWSATGAFAVVWGVTGGLALGAASDLKKLKTTHTTAAALSSGASKAKTLGITSDVMMGFTIAGAGVSTVLTVLALKKPASAAAAPSGATPHAFVDFSVGPGNVLVFGSF